MGAGIALGLSLVLLGLIDFFFLRGVGIIVGEVIGFLGVAGVWYLLHLLRVVM